MVVIFSLVRKILSSRVFDCIIYNILNAEKAHINQEIARSGFLLLADLFSSSRPFNAPLGGLIVYYIPLVQVIVLPL